MSESYHHDNSNLPQTVTYPNYVAPIPPAPPVTINVNVNVNNGDEELDVREEIHGFAMTMEDELQKEETDLQEIGIEELIRKAEEKLSGIKAAVELQLSPDTLLSEACMAANYLMAAVEVYAQDLHESH